MFKRLLFILFFLSFAINLYCGEDPEPTTADIEYKAQICWGTITTTSIWLPLTITYNVVVGNATTAHVYGGKLGLQVWEAIPCIFDPLNPTKVVFTFTIDTAPTNKVVNFYRVRLIGVAKGQIPMDTDPNWSDPSYWVVIYNVPKAVPPIYTGTRGR